MMKNRWLISSFWLLLLSGSIYAKIKLASLFVCERSLPLNGLESWLVIIFTVFFLHRFLFSVCVKLNKDRKVQLFLLLTLVYFAIVLKMENKTEINDLKEKGGVVISSKILSKHSSKKGRGHFTVIYNYLGNSVERFMEVEGDDFKKKKEGDKVLVLFSPTCRSTIIKYDFYPSKSDIKKCLNGCEFEYGKKGLSPIRSKKQKTKD
ncbi:hypothetical protein [Marivirga arenosa]|uniref:DUF3592 domain-containing protein n=1 Tax=Marivirga arenosa TaxID=3059076 RepID=A0AA51X4U6_9BACT|nr:hypothetical protein [Marivirga sp. BKB1-2]WNB17086.1 hypothetical protein QYS47_32895 [Marivirga sp. BKB1-2]